MPSTLKTNTLHHLRNALVVPEAYNSVKTVVEAGSGTLTQSARLAFRNALCSAHAATRLCDMIDNRTGTISTRDIGSVKIALTNKNAADDFLTIVYTNASGSYPGTGI